MENVIERLYRSSGIGCVSDANIRFNDPEQPGSLAGIVVRINRISQKRLTLIGRQEYCPRVLTISPSKRAQMSSRNRFPRLNLCCLNLIALIWFVPVCAQTPQDDNSWDFENSLHGWTKTGSAFDSQPVNGSGFHTDFPANLVKVGGD